MVGNSATLGAVLGRLGNVLYWAACSFAAVLAFLAAIDFLLSAFPDLPGQIWRGASSPTDDPYYGFSIPTTGHPPTWLQIAEASLMLIGAGGVWLAGRAARYVLGGR